MMEINAEIVAPFYDYGGRKYLDLRWDGQVTRVKVPFRYKKVMCHIDGITPVQELKKGQKIHALVEKKLWEGDVHWIVHSITCENTTPQPQ
jgi:hypothetical protein